MTQLEYSLLIAPTESQLPKFSYTQHAEFWKAEIMLFPDDKRDAKLRLELLSAMIESFLDGILIFTTEGELILSNEYARRICSKLTPPSANHAIPTEIWRVCQSLIESRQLFPQKKIIIESEIQINASIQLRIRARFLELKSGSDRLLIVTVEDYQQYTQSIAIADAKKYHLTDRETQVWQLRRANFSYQQIANQLYITINTVKKHLKNIHAKQQSIFW